MMALWGRRSGAHGASLADAGAAHVFVHSVPSADPFGEQRAKIPGLSSLAERALLLARRGDVVCIAEPVEAAYLDFLAEHGLGPEPDRVVVPLDVETAARRPLPAVLAGEAETLDRIAALVGRADRVVLHPFLASPHEHRLASMLAARLGREVPVFGGPHEVAAAANRKDLVRARALSLGVPVARGEAVKLRIGADGRPLDVGPLRAAVLRQLPATGRVIVRGAYGGGGTSLFIIRDRDESLDAALSAIAARPANRVYLVEELLAAAVSPNLQMRIGPDGVAFFGATDQRWSGPLSHGGNLHPSTAPGLEVMVRQATRLCEWLRDCGYVGVAGLDFFEAVDPRTGEPVPFLAEINARMNAATYTLALVDRLDRTRAERGRTRIPAFATAWIDIGVRTFAAQRRRFGDALYDPEAGAGVFPFATGLLHWGQLGVAVLGGTSGEVLEVLERFRARVAPTGAALPGGAGTAPPALAGAT